MNLYGIMDGESPERNIVDLLYFPTGGGKTEAYLGLIAFTVAYRRLTASDETDYEKDGGVTVFLRYTLRLLTTQQRDRLMRLIVAMEQLREKNENYMVRKEFQLDSGLEVMLPQINLANIAILINLRRKNL